MPTVINYNSGRLSNTTDTSSIGLGADETLLVSLGIFVAQATNTLEIISTVGATLAAASEALYEITLDGLTVGSANVTSTPGEDTTTTFQTILSNVPAGHHVIRLFGTEVAGTVTVDGPVTVSAWVIA